ncbi:GFA family protein [Kordiimonas lipolytica]|uniref:GFA family protein n=1 Tax=Kordiimonas lipolytica TaxID=1662421 RepID=A0ABV8UF33_9PROT|nr:GFA family protein [Kordiimonas lipolytica]
MTGEFEGRCTCGQVHYRMTSVPLVVHCCHCSWCQRESGGAFALNALIESDRLEVIKGGLARLDVPSESGKGQILIKCPDCLTTLWSHYAGMGEQVSFVRVGTLEDPAALPPDVHIFTNSKQPWVTLGSGTPAMPEYYRKADIWKPDAIQRFNTLIGKIREP